MFTPAPSFPEGTECYELENRPMAFVQFENGHWALFAFDPDKRPWSPGSLSRCSPVSRGKFDELRAAFAALRTSLRRASISRGSRGPRQ